MLPRILEPELMDTAEDAREYDAMDHSIVNAQFVSDVLRTVMDYSRPPLTKFLDLGAGTALIPIELCRRATGMCVIAVDAAEHMLALGRKNVAAAGLADRIELVRGDAKHLDFSSSKFNAVISNSILHHIADPRDVIAEAIRVAAPGALLFHRDLCRPSDELQVEHLVSTYAAGATSYQQKLLDDSLRAALTLEEIRVLVDQFGFAPDTVSMSSDRHWTWAATSQKCGESLMAHELN
ncbi:MAG: class I SAM-dependent methyltransferase [Pirellulales bacterium]